MKIIIFATLIISLISIFSKRVRNFRAKTKNGGFSRTCRNISLNGTKLQGRCANKIGIKMWTALDLDTCIGNIEGKLQGNQGGYSKTSHYCFLQHTTLSCESRTSSGSYKTTQINLDSVVGNMDGILKC